MDKALLIQSAVKASEVLRKVSFPELVEATSGYMVFFLDRADSKDNELYEKLATAANSLLKICHKTRRRFQGNRINEVGIAIEEEFVQELRKTDLSPRLLIEKGYPDMELDDRHGRKTYLESKATSKQWDDTFRSFYYSNGKKITTNARHLLIGWKIEEENDKYWKLVDWKLVDLFYLNVGLKSEFNASNKDIYIGTQQEEQKATQSVLSTA
ncbi:MAG: hypothetical protein JW771_06250 [Candidatus Thermoplasmatota archaeon]|nr:hypothetical protein [Candidatus Thermoplasmatota archaeon]